MRGMGNMQNMMRQMQKLQKQMSQTQDELNKTEFTGKASDDMVTVVFTGNRNMKDITINPEAIDPDDPDMLQDLIIQAVNDAMQQIDKETQNKLGRYTRGLM